MKIEQYNSPHHSNRGNYVPDIIVCHIAEGTYIGTVGWFQNPDSKVSSHFVVAKDGRVAQCVDLKRVAWCNGTADEPEDKRYFGKSTLETVKTRGGNANDYTISIEFEGFWKDGKGALTAPQLKSGVELIKYIRQSVKSIYGVDIPIDRQHIVGHCEINPVTKPNCPGANFPFNAIISGLKQMEPTTYCVHVPGVSTMGECESIKSWIQNNAAYNVIIEEEK